MQQLENIATGYCILMAAAIVALAVWEYITD
jgi:hypothetical protein